MIRHYLITILRSVARHKAQAAANIIGLSIGLATALQVPETLIHIEKLWGKFGDGRPLTRRFFQDYIQDLYRDIAQQAKFSGLCIFVALFLSSLSLFSLSLFMAERRTKEIGVRKALGAQKAVVTRMLLRDFTKPVLWAALLSWPVSYYFMERWLHTFAYRIELDLWLFPVISALVLFIALLTVSVHAWALPEPTRPWRFVMNSSRGASGVV